MGQAVGDEAEDKALESQKANSTDTENKFGDPYEFDEEIFIATQDEDL